MFEPHLQPFVVLLIFWIGSHAFAWASLDHDPPTYDLPHIQDYKCEPWRLATSYFVGQMVLNMEFTVNYYLHGYIHFIAFVFTVSQK
jgi:hypothetical protein